jgi:hypothetical protein
MYDKVFISYAKEDFAFAEKLYYFLQQNNFMPWLDKVNIMPGQDWDLTIKKALRDANYIILLLSETSVNKRGYVQREFKLALEFFEEKLEDDIYIIPLKINECAIPNKLSKFQWVEHDNQNCFKQIIEALNSQKEKYLGKKNQELEKDYISSINLKSTFRVRILNQDGDLHYERYFYLELKKDKIFTETRKDLVSSEFLIDNFPPTAKVISSIPRNVSLTPSYTSIVESIRGGRKHYDYLWRYKLTPALKKKNDFIEYGYSAIIPKCEPKAFTKEGALFFFYHQSIPLDIKYSLLAPPSYCINIIDYWIEEKSGRKEKLNKSEAPFLDDSGQLLSWLPKYRKEYCFICKYNLIEASVHWATPPVER